MKEQINKIRERRERRVRAGIRGTAERPRLSVFRSHRSIYAQLIDDSVSRTLAAAASKELKKTGDKKNQAKAVGELLAKKAKEIGIKSAIFDRGAYQYHGRVKALAEAFKESGLKL
ncbi:MAG: 50S ribosomal protein L18 [bacterium]|nr:50S ribosomal protein L18 [bacterium]